MVLWSVLFFFFFEISKKFNLILLLLFTDHPDESSKRTLTLVAKTLQNLANLVEFGEKESYMIFLNTFILDHRKKFKRFVDEICVLFSYSFSFFILIKMKKH